MAKRLGYAFLGAVLAYFAGLFGCIWLLPIFGPHGPDSGLGASVAGAMFIGPILAFLTFVIVLAVTEPKRGPTKPKP